MFRRFSVNFAIFSMIFDGALVALSLVVAVVVRPSLSWLSFAKPVTPHITVPLELYIIFPVTWVVVLLLLSVYDGRRNLRWSNELASLTLGAGLASVSIAGFLYLSYREISRFLFLIFVVLAYTLMVLWRMAVRFAGRQGQFAMARRRVLIVGAGELGDRLRYQIIQNRGLGLEFIGFLEDEYDHHVDQDGIVGVLDDTRRIIKDSQIDDVVITLPLWDYERVNSLVGELNNLPVKVWVIPDYFSLAMHQAVVEEFAGIPMVDLRAPALSDYQRMLKRMFDLVFTFVFLLFAMPVMGLIALVIHFDSPGPVIFRQKRVGENGRLFGMLKFRTMVANAEDLRHLVERVDENGKLIHKQARDPRVTRFGRFLRQNSLDELPQFFNVLKGDMSVVGPRPELPYLVEKYDSWQRRRFAIPQGITGWWQVNGRSDKPMHLHTEDDLYYIQHYSIWLDLRILLMTVKAALSRQGAY